jgi:hypothetical protein
MSSVLQQLAGLVVCVGVPFGVFYGGRWLLRWLQGEDEIVARLIAENMANRKTHCRGMDTMDRAKQSAAVARQHAALVKQQRRADRIRRAHDQADKPGARVATFRDRRRRA